MLPGTVKVAPSVRRLMELIAEHQEDNFVTVTHDDLVQWLDEISKLMDIAEGLGE